MSERLADPVIARFLDTKDVVVLATIEPDGTPLLTPMWFCHGSDSLTMITLAASRKAANVARDARVAVVAESGDRENIRRVTIVGRATLVPASPEREPMIDHFVAKYAAYVERRWGGRRMPDDRVVLRIEPRTVRSFGLRRDPARAGGSHDA